MRGVVNRTKIGRREVLRLGFLAAVAGLSPVPLFGAAGPAGPPDRKISLYNTHTGESLEGTYCFQGRYCPDSLKEIDRLLRDHRTGEIFPIDPGLLDYLHAISTEMDVRGPFHVISGFRSPATNQMLRGHSRNVARNSLHTRGMAVDVRVPDRDLRALRKAALGLKRGGVGFYPGADFVHVDVGPVRSW